MDGKLIDDPERLYAEVLQRAAADPAVVGVVVFGSRAAGPYAQAISDVDVFVVVDGDAADVRAWQTEHGSPVDSWAMTLEEFRNHALPGSATAWNRPEPDLAWLRGEAPYRTSLSRPGTIGDHDGAGAR